MPIIITPGAGVAEELEQLELDGLALASSTFRLVSLSMPPPAKKPEFVSGADSEGAILARDPKHENRVIEAVVGVQQQANHAAVVAHIGSLLDKLQECGRNANGLPLLWDPAGSTADPITFRCVLGEITDLPLTWESLRFSNAWEFTVRLTCLPFGEGVEYQVATVTSAAPIIPLELANIKGDVPALGRLVVTDAASQSRRYVAWGLESRHYPTSSPPSLIIDSANMVTSGYAGATGADALAYGASALGLLLRPQVQAIAGLGNLSHVGSFRPQLRFYASHTSMAVRLTYQVGDGPMSALPYRVPVTTGWNHVDMGLITIPESTLGTQRWTGRIEAYSTAVGGETFNVDGIWLMPAEQYGRARGTYAYRPGVVTGEDSFAAIASGTVLNGRVAPIGGTWATSGAATDFAATTGVFAGLDEVEMRGTVSDASTRYAILGGTNYTGMEAEVSVVQNAAVPTERGVIARWVDSSNHLRLRLVADPAGNSMTLRLATVVAGVASEATAVAGGPVPNIWYRLHVVVFPSGLAIGSLYNAAYRGGALIAQLKMTSSALATGGALASGKPGFSDRNPTATATLRFYDGFASATPPAEPIVCYSGQSIEFRHDSTLREDSTGVYAGDPPEYVGSRFTVPNAGGPGHKTRVAVVARRNDVETAGDNAVAGGATMDSTTVTAFATPRYLAIPRT